MKGQTYQVHSVALFVAKTPKVTTGQVASQLGLTHDAARQTLRHAQKLGWIQPCEGYTPTAWGPREVEL